MKAITTLLNRIRITGKLLLAVLLCCVGWCNAWGWGENTSYVLNDIQEQSWSTIGETKSYTLNGPGKTLIFEAKREAIVGFSNNKNFFAEYSTDNGISWKEALTITLEKTNQYYPLTCDIPENATHVKFETKTEATGKRYIRNVKVTRATTLSSVADQDMGEIKIGESKEIFINVDYNNTYYPQQIIPEYNQGVFTVSTEEAGETGTATVKITCTPKEIGDFSEDVTLTMNGVQTTFNVKCKGINAKYTPVFTWGLTQAYLNRTYKCDDIFQSSNQETGYTITSNDESMAIVENNIIAFKDKEGTASFTVTQEESENYFAKTETYTVNVSRAQNHLPLNITGDNQAALVQSENGTYTWDNGIRLGTTTNLATGNKNDKTVIIPFEGIPLNISFTYNRSTGLATGIYWYIEESGDGTNWSKIWESESNEGTADQPLSPTTRYVRLCYSGNYAGIFHDVTITERRYLTAEPNNIDFGKQVEEDDVPIQTFTLKHCNAGFGVTLSSDNPEQFTVSPTTLTTTGGDLMGEETISVKFKNITPGTHSGTIIITDPNGQNETVNVTVNGQTRACRIALNPTETPGYEAGEYKEITLLRTLNAGWSTLAVPYSTTVGEIAPGQEEAYVAQLALVTYNEQDGYSLYFRKVEDGSIAANQPYLIYLGSSVSEPKVTAKMLEESSESSIPINNWTMQSNYKPGLPMEGKYGMAGGKLHLGLEGSTLNGYTAYFTPPAETRGIRVRLAVEDGDGNTTWIGNLTDDGHILPQMIYGADGMQRSKLHRGVNIVRQADGTMQKVWKE